MSHARNEVAEREHDDSRRRHMLDLAATYQRAAANKSRGDVGAAPKTRQPQGEPPNCYGVFTPGQGWAAERALWRGKYGR
jgi:hypothetical protein